MDFYAVKLKTQDYRTKCLLMCLVTVMNTFRIRRMGQRLLVLDSWKIWKPCKNVTSSACTTQRAHK